MAAKEPELEVEEPFLARLPPDLRERIPEDWAAARRERSEAAAEWRWAKNSTGDDDLEPLSVERMGYRPGRRRRPPPPEGTDLDLYGYDERGRTVIATQRDGIGEDERHTLLWHEDDKSLALRATAPRADYHGDLWPPRLEGVTRARIESGLPVEIESHGESGSSRELCRWDGERLVEATVEHAEAPHRDLLTWDGATLVRVTRHWSSGTVEVVYERVPEGVKLPDLLRAIEDELVERIPSAVAELGYREPVCAMALSYCLGERFLPPGLVLCPQAVRDGLEAEADDAFWYRWQAAEWMSAADVPEVDGYGGADFLERCATVDRQIALDGDARLTARLLRSVARRLNERDWSDLLAPTDDFLVYAWEIHGEDLEEDLAASAPGGGARPA